MRKAQVKAKLEAMGAEVLYFPRKVGTTLFVNVPPEVFFDRDTDHSIVVRNAKVAAIKKNLVGFEYKILPVESKHTRVAMG